MKRSGMGAIFACLVTGMIYGRCGFNKRWFIHRSKPSTADHTQRRNGTPYWFCAGGDGFHLANLFAYATHPSRLKLTSARLDLKMTHG
jgi:hypothetical protein